jgi:hypothetical protein
LTTVTRQHFVDRVGWGVPGNWRRITVPVSYWFTLLAAGSGYHWVIVVREISRQLGCD